MKKIESLTFFENQSKGEMSASVFRGHASVRLLFDCFEAGESLDVWLKPADAVQIANAILVAAKELEGSEPQPPSFGLVE